MIEFTIYEWCAWILTITLAFGFGVFVGLWFNGIDTTKLLLKNYEKYKFMKDIDNAKKK